MLDYVMPEKKRIVFLDWLRAAACLMVMLVHSSECVYSDDYSFSFPSEFAKWSVMFIQCFVRPVAVPLFLMASAYLLVPVKTGTKAFLKKRFSRVGIPFVVFLFLYAFLPAVWGEFSWAEAWGNVRQAGINFIPRESHLWFVYMMLGLYLVMPVISPWLAKVGRKEELFFLGVWVFTLCFYWIRDKFGPVFGECWWNPYPLFYYVSGFVGYIVLGHYIRAHVRWPERKTVLVCVPLLIAFYAFGLYQFYSRSFVTETPAQLEMHLQNDTIVAGVMSACMFLLFRCIKNSGKVYGVVRKISEASYGMYLMHMLMLPAIFGLLNPVLPVPLTIICTAVLTYTFSFLLSYAIGKLPFGKYIVG
jgi:surface polysaccharide O-acyltransferase-like enzyme